MGHSLTDGKVYEVESSLGALTEREGTSTADATNGYTRRRWDQRYTWVNRIEDALVTVPTRSAQWISPRWLRLFDRKYAPRRWWWPTEAQVALSQEDLQRRHAEYSETVNRLLFVLLGFCFFCLLTLGGSDAALLGAGREVSVPVINMHLSNGVFLSVGPIILIALTLYMHIFVERLRQYDALDTDRRLPHIFNMSSPVPRLLSWFLFYWMVPLVLVSFTWKAIPRPEGPTIATISIAATTLLIWLQIRRCPKATRRWNVLLGVVMIALIALAPLIATRQIQLNRQLGLYQAELKNADLSGFDLRWANLGRANLEGAFLSKADLRHAKLRQANLAHAVLEEAVLNNADLSWATGLREVDLNGICLHKAVLYQTDLRGANLEGAQGLLREQLVYALTDSTTRFPSYLTMESEAQHSFAGLSSTACR
jgi:Pentapeptide repeats (8 copies)